MNTILTTMTMPTGGHGLSGILISFLVLVIVLAIIGGLIYLIEAWIVKAPLPSPVRLVIGLILVILVIIWGINTFGGG